MNKRGFYSVFTTWIVIAVLLGSIATLFLVNKLMLRQNAERTESRIVEGEFDYARERFQYCYGNIADEDNLLSRLDCLEMKGDMGLSIEYIGYYGCQKHFLKELNYRGFGKTKSFDIAMYRNASICPAKVTLYEHAVIVPLLTNISVSPLFVTRPRDVSTRIEFYHTVYPSFIMQKILAGSANVGQQESGALYANSSSFNFTVNTAQLNPGIHDVAIAVTHDSKYWDENRKAGRFRVVPENDTPVFGAHLLGPERGTMRDTFKVVVNLTDYTNISWVAVAVDDGTDVLVYANLTRQKDSIDMDGLVWHFQYAGGISGALLPNLNATYNVTLVAVNDLNNSAVKQVGEISMAEVHGFDVAIVAIRGYLDSKYTAAEISGLESRLEDFADAIQADGLNADFIYLDSDELQNLIGTQLEGGPPYTYSQIDGIMQQLHDQTNNTYAIIIGGQGIFPMAQINGENADGMMQYEYTDDLYSDMTGDYVPDIALGRILDPIDGDMPLLLSIIDNSIRYHGSGGVDFSSYHSDGMEGLGPGMIWSSMICFNQQNWGSLHPPNTHTRNFPCNGLTDANGIGFYALLLHGSAGRPPESFTQEFACNSGSECACRFPGGGTVSSEIAALDLDGATWITMPCHGGHVQDKRIVAESIPMSFHRAGGLIYIGSTNNNLGAAMGCQTVGGVIVGDFHVGALYSFMSSHFDIGERVGDAYMDGKRDYMQRMPNHGGNEYQQRINCYFGDPTLKIASIW